LEYALRRYRLETITSLTSSTELFLLSKKSNFDGSRYRHHSICDHTNYCISRSTSLGDRSLKGAVKERFFGTHFWRAAAEVDCWGARSSPGSRQSRFQLTRTPATMTSRRGTPALVTTTGDSETDRIISATIEKYGCVKELLSALKKRVGDPTTPQNVGALEFPYHTLIEDEELRREINQTKSRKQDVQSLLDLLLIKFTGSSHIPFGCSPCRATIILFCA
jgi:hypothetical protein